MNTQLQLSETETRVLGALIEKDITTPDYYPLSLNALVNACNQKNNRDPVMALDENSVREALSSLQEKRLAGPLVAQIVESQNTSTACRRCLTSIAGRSRCCVFCCCAGRRPQASFVDAANACIASKRWTTCNQACSGLWTGNRRWFAFSPGNPEPKNRDIPICFPANTLRNP